MTAYLSLYKHGERIGRSIMDTPDALHFAQWQWTIDKSGYAVRCEYIRGSGRANQQQRRYRLHREIMGLGPWKEDRREVDHINRNRLDNRRSNLRIVTHAQQAQNRRMVAPRRGFRTSQYRGVSWSEHAKRWTIRVWHEDKNINGGYFDTEDEANQAVLAVRRELMPFAD